jgi:hypothetical protein
MQAASDVFLGWHRLNPAPDGVVRDFYIRQLRDWKFSLDTQDMAPKGLSDYGEVCAWTLARAHARSGDRIAISAYLGNSDSFDRAIGAFASAYADQQADYAALREAAESGGSSHSAAYEGHPAQVTRRGLRTGHWIQSTATESRYSCLNFRCSTL